MGEDRVALALGDVSGKGVHAALLMANLQAAVRTLSSVGAEDPAALMRQVNRMLLESTAPEHFVTLFYGVYDDRTRELVYVNAGHNPPVWLALDGSVRRLAATATVIGILERWDTEIGRARLAPGDLVAIFSDGVSEAERGEEEFEEERLIAELRARRERPAAEIVEGVLAEVQEHSAGRQSDDLTLLIGRVR